MGNSIIMDLADGIVGHLSAEDAGAILLAVPFSPWRQQDIATEIRNKVAKQSACGLVYPLAASRDATAGKAYDLTIRIDIYSNKILPHDKPPAADIAEAVAKRIDRWMPADTFHGHERIHVTSMSLQPDDNYVVWQVEAMTTRYILSDNS